MPIVYAFWNNKGGTGKTSLAFQSIALYAEKHPEERILAIDLCPQANLWGLRCLAGSTAEAATSCWPGRGWCRAAALAAISSCGLPSASPYQVPNFQPQDYITKPVEFNEAIPENIDLVCGDPILELQSIAVNPLANTQIPTTNPWILWPEL